MFIELNNPLNLNKPIENIDLLHLAMIFALNKLEKNNPKIADNKKILGNLVYKEKQDQLIEFYKYLFKYADPKDIERTSFSIKRKFYSFRDEKLKEKFKSKKDKDLFYFFYEELKKLIDDTNQLNQTNKNTISPDQLLDDYMIVFNKLHGTGKPEDKSTGNKTMFTKPEGDNFGKICFLKISPFAIEDKENIKKLINKDFLKEIYNPYLLKYNEKKESKKVSIEYYANQFSNFLLYDQEKFLPNKNNVKLIELDDEYKKKFNQNSQQNNQDQKFAILEKFNTGKYNYGGILYDLKLEEKRENFKLYEIIKNNSFQTFLFQWILNYYIFGNQDMVYFNFIAKFDSKNRTIKNLQIIDYECVFEKETSQKRIKTIQKLGPYYSLMTGLIQTAHENHNFKRKIDFELLNAGNFNIEKSKIVQYYNEKGELVENKSQTLAEAIKFLSENRQDRPHGKLVNFIFKNYNKEQIDEIFSEFFTIFNEKSNSIQNLNDNSCQILKNYIDNFFIKQLSMYKIKNGENSSLNEQGEKKFDSNFEDFMNFIKGNVKNLQEGIQDYNKSKNKNQKNDGIFGTLRNSFRLSKMPQQKSPRTNLYNQKINQVKQKEIRK